MEQTTQVKYKGRVKGSLSKKYRDSNGNPIDVMTWRKQNPKYRNKFFPQYIEISAEPMNLLKLLSQTSGRPRGEILDEALKLYLKDKLNKQATPKHVCSNKTEESKRK